MSSKQHQPIKTEAVCLFQDYSFGSPQFRLSSLRNLEIGEQQEAYERLAQQRGGLQKNARIAARFGDVVFEKSDLAEINLSEELSIWKTLCTSGLDAVDPRDRKEFLASTVASLGKKEVILILDDRKFLAQVKNLEELETKEQVIDRLKHFYCWLKDKVPGVRNPLM